MKIKLECLFIFTHSRSRKAQVPHHLKFSLREWPDGMNRSVVGMEGQKRGKSVSDGEDHTQATGGPSRWQDPGAGASLQVASWGAFQDDETPPRGGAQPGTTHRSFMEHKHIQNSQRGVSGRHPKQISCVHSSLLSFIPAGTTSSMLSALELPP